MRSLNEGLEDYLAQNRGDFGDPPLMSAIHGPGQSFLAEVPLSTGSGVRVVRALVYWEKPHSVQNRKLVTPNEDIGTAPRTQPYHLTPPTGKFGNARHDAPHTFRPSQEVRNLCSGGSLRRNSRSGQESSRGP